MTVGRVIAVVLLTALWLLTLVSADPLDALVGLALAVVLVAVLPGQRQAAPGPDRPPVLRRALAFPRFVVAMVANAAAGTWDVTLRVLHLRPVDRPGVVLVPIGERTAAGIAAGMLADNLSPGTVLVDVDHERGVLLVHVIDASDPEAFRAAQARFYERHQRGAFP